MAGVYIYTQMTATKKTGNTGFPKEQIGGDESTQSTELEEGTQFDFESAIEKLDADLERLKLQTNFGQSLDLNETL